ncbi:CRISPR system precrRNA processing endoribonuclease RAMP protein Cas6 [Pyrobaculum neutrophilum]|uniref:CRISPR-associated protein Cas6 n=1 Tax=Pyrobaculum neutrophilum (strain DSM 2338 / JCM 9278 / NBRC 100436 / V24Sta) TaxID=444157 RepID=B1YBS2_PYRNV|nr:CRISPR system precrRNA processing endoribonuclease RAMP protein Cas6 [Pyrobaculum neutrophilum]ACB39306.1 CRISPR-associated protein Cas6 [Pyrobaculum neutrophilum V24Sta]
MVVAVSVKARVASPCLLTGWSGSLVYNFFLTAIRRSAEPKGRVYAHPLYYGGAPVLSGLNGSQRAFEPGAAFELRALLSDHDARLLLDSLAAEPRVEAGCVFEAVGVDIAPADGKLEEGHGMAAVDVAFYPTAFMFHGRDVLYPSPQRLAYSLAKTYRQLYGVDLKELADRAPTALELVGMRVRTGWLNIGEARKVPVFHGRARLAIYGDVGKWLSLLKLGELTGVGISRAIGLGKYRIEKVEILI